MVTAVVKVLAHAFFVMAVGLLFMGIGRRFSARFHRRYGPRIKRCTHPC